MPLDRFFVRSGAFEQTWPTRHKNASGLTVFATTLLWGDYDISACQAAASGNTKILIS
jgi:hypothetical protein